MKAIMISIQPQWVAMIVHKKKTLEIRKTMPKCDLPCKVYIYCSYGDMRTNYMLGKRGKVVAEFMLNNVDFIKMPANITKEFQEKSCVSGTQLMKYLGGEYFKSFYAWHIDDLKIYDKPKELSEFTSPDYIPYEKPRFYFPTPLRRPPQSWCYVEDLDEN